MSLRFRPVPVLALGLVTSTLLVLGLPSASAGDFCYGYGSDGGGSCVGLRGGGYRNLPVDGLALRELCAGAYSGDHCTGVQS
jgi:hypothetical protein